MNLFRLLLCVVMFAGGAAVAAVPTIINYQGKLTDSGGAPVNTTVSMVFKIYDASTAGTQLWTETQGSVSVNNGVFNVQLGSVTPIAAATLTQADLWLGVTVGADAEMSPRQKLSSTPFTLKSSVADSATSLAANGTNCTAGSYPLGVDASGNAEGCTVASGGGVTAVYSAVGGDITASATNYHAITGQTTGSTLFDTRWAIVPVSCTAKNLYVKNYHYNSGSAGQHVVTLMKGTTGTPSATALTCTVSNVALIDTVTQCSDTTNTVTVTAGDYLVMQVASTSINGGTEADANAGASSITYGFTCE